MDSSQTISITDINEAIHPIMGITEIRQIDDAVAIIIIEDVVVIIREDMIRGEVIFQILTIIGSIMATIRMWQAMRAIMANNHNNSSSNQIIIISRSSSSKQ